MQLLGVKREEGGGGGVLKEDLVSKKLENLVQNQDQDGDREQNQQDYEDVGDKEEIEEEHIKQQLQTAYSHYGKTLLERASAKASGGMDWLRKGLGTVTGTQKVYEWLQTRVEDESFVKCLEDAREANNLSYSSKTKSSSPPALKQVEKEVLAQAHQGSESESESERRLNGQEAEGLSEGWELVEKEEVLDAMALFIAAYIQAHPQAMNMKPHELQQALSGAFKELRKSKVVVLWQWGSTIWRLGAMSYGAFTVYTNPWLVRTVLQATWCCSRLAIGATATAIGLL